MDHARCGQDRQPFVGIEAAKHVTRKQRKVELFRSVRPLTQGLVEGRERLESLAFQALLSSSFKVRANVQRIPMLIVFGGHRLYILYTRKPQRPRRKN